jgi:hypothetical protein
MPFTGNTYTPPIGAENAAPGQVVQSAVWDSIFTDLSSALTLLMTNLNTAATFNNILIPNGGFSVWQRGAGLTASFAVPASTTQYTADRWYITTGVNQASVVSAAAGLEVGIPPAHAVKIIRNAGQTGITSITFGYPLDTDDINRLRGNNISFSGQAKAGADWSPTGGTLNVNVYFGTGAVAKRGGGFTNETNPLSLNTIIAAGGAATTISGTGAGTVATNVTQGEIQVTWTPVGTAGADDSITLDGFCLVAGSTVVQFADIPFAEALQLCKRYYRKSFGYNTAPAQNAGLAGSAMVNGAASLLAFYVQMEPIELRATATITTYNPLGASSAWLNNTLSTSVTATLDTAAPGPKGFGIFTAVSVSADSYLYIHYQADAGI